MVYTTFNTWVGKAQFCVLYLGGEMPEETE